MRGTRGATQSRGQRLLYPPPSLDLRLAETKSLTDWVSGSNLITFSRASSGTTIDSTGALVTVAAGSPRFTHNPTTGESLGLLVEESRTNSIRNNTMQGAVVGTPGTLPTNWVASSISGLNRTIVGTGTENGISYIDIRINGTTTSALFYSIRPEPITQIAALNAQTWTSTFYAKLVGGSFTNITRIVHVNVFNDAVGTNLQFGTAAITPTNSALNTQRFSLTTTASNASTAFVQLAIQIEANSGVAVDITLRIGLPQLEQGAFATSVIPTTTATVTRSADIASITGTNFSSWYNQSEGTFFVSGQMVAGASATFPRMVSAVGANVNNEEFCINWTSPSGLMRGGVRTPADGFTVDLSAGSSITNGSNYSAAFAASNQSAIMASGASLSAVDTSVVMPSPIALQIGAPSSFQPNANTTIRHLTYWPQRLPNNTLVAITR